jgi:hypothetical protein
MYPSVVNSIRLKNLNALSKVSRAIRELALDDHDGPSVFKEINPKVNASVFHALGGRAELQFDQSRQRLRVNQNEYVRVRNTMGWTGRPLPNVLVRDLKDTTDFSSPAKYLNSLNSVGEYSLAELCKRTETFVRRHENDSDEWYKRGRNMSEIRFRGQRKSHPTGMSFEIRFELPWASGKTSRELYIRLYHCTIQGKPRNPRCTIELTNDLGKTYTLDVRIDDNLVTSFKARFAPVDRISIASLCDLVQYAHDALSTMPQERQAVLDRMRDIFQSILEDRAPVRRVLKRPRSPSTLPSPVRRVLKRPRLPPPSQSRVALLRAQRGSGAP